MSNQYINFQYDPARQGYDSEVWSLLNGIAPVSSTGSLEINAATIYHYGDCLRGDFVMNFNVPNAPRLGDNRIFGLYQYKKGAYLAFSIIDTVFTAKSGDGNGNTNSVAITWQSTWTNTSTEFRIRWEAGLAHFYIGGAWQAAISDVSVSGDPMSLYVSNGNTDNLQLNYIDAKAIQSFFMNTPISGSETNLHAITMNELLKITESLTIVFSPLFMASVISDSLTNTESISTGYGAGFIPGQSVVDTLTNTESISTGYGAGFIPSKSVTDQLTVSESLTVFTTIDYISGVVDSLTITENLTVILFALVPSVTDSLTVSEFYLVLPPLI